MARKPKKQPGKHAASDVRIVKCLDGLHFSFQILDHIFSDLHLNVSLIKVDQQSLVPALWRCWSFVDVVHRIREIAQALPGLSRKKRALVQFLSATCLAEDFRHYIQHLRGELSKKEINPFPVWGSLAWVDPTDSTCTNTVFIGAQLEGTGVSSCVFDTVERRWVSNVCLSVAGKSLNIDPIYKACITFRKFVIPWALSAYKPGVKISESPPILSAHIVLPAEDDKK